MILFGVCCFNESFCHFAHYLRVNQLQIKNFLLCFERVVQSLFSTLSRLLASEQKASLSSRTIQRPRTRSAAARQMSNAHERDLVTNQNIYFGRFQVKHIFWKVLFPIEFASSRLFQPAATG